MRVLLALIALAGCTKETPSNPTPPPVPSPNPPGPNPLPTDDATTSNLVLLQQHDGRSPDGEFLFAEFTPDPKVPPKLHLLGKRTLHGTPARRQHQALASHDGNHWARVARAGTITVEAALTGPVLGKASYNLSIGALEPHAIHLVGDALYVGSEKSVCWIDLSRSAPDAPCVELARRDHAYKSYDLFVHRADRVLAIDDEVSPMYADWFATDAHGKPTKRVGDWKLPDVINGLYTYAALHDSTLYLVAPYGIMSGEGHDVVALPIVADKPVFAPDLTTQNPDGKTPILEEHVDRSRRRRSTLLAGTAFSPFTGIAVAPAAKRVLLAAGPRGLLSIPLDFKPDYTAIELGAEVSDVIVRGKRVLVLAGRDLVSLDPATLAVVQRTTLPTKLERFVRVISSHVLVVPLRGAGQDRAAVVEILGGLVAVLADGAGGTAGGGAAADAVIAAVTARAAPGLDWCAVLEELDRPSRHGGQTTAIVVEVTSAGLRGASVGDSQAAIIGAEIDDLTRFQRRKPLLGSGEADVMALGAGPLAGRLVIASDGLWKYAAPRDLAQVVRDTAALADVAARLVQLVRPPQDDISIIVVG